MATGFRSIDGLVDPGQGYVEVKFADMGGDPGSAVDTIVCIAYATGLPPNMQSIGITMLGGVGAASGTDNNGSISVAKTLVDSGDGKTFLVTGGGQILFRDGFWASGTSIFVNYVGGTRGFIIQYSGSVVADFTGAPFTEAPYDLADGGHNFVDEEGDIELTFNYDNTAAENPDGFIIERSLAQSGGIQSDYEIVGTAPWNNGVFDYSYIDYVDFGCGTYTYRVRTYKISGMQLGPPSNTITWTPDTVCAIDELPPLPFLPPLDYPFPLPLEPPDKEPPIELFPPTIPFPLPPPETDLSVIGSGGINLGGVAQLIFIKNPSGIYVVTEGKTNDTLYERLGSITEQNVKIPDPFGKTGFLDVES